MFLFNVSVAGTCRQGSKILQLRYYGKTWPFTSDSAPVFLMNSDGAIAQGTYAVHVQNAGAPDPTNDHGNEYTRKQLKAQNAPDWYQVAPLWTSITLANPLTRDIPEDSLLVFTVNGTTYRVPVGFTPAHTTVVKVKDDLTVIPGFSASSGNPVAANLDFEPVSITSAGTLPFSLITLTLSQPLQLPLYTYSTVTVYFNDKDSRGWDKRTYNWKVTRSGEYDSGEANANLTAFESDSSSSVSIYPYLNVKHGNLTLVRDRVDISAGGVALFDGLGSFHTHVTQTLGMLSIYYNRYSLDATIASYIRSSLLSLLNSLSVYGVDKGYPAPYAYSSDCNSFPAREEDQKYTVIQATATNGLISLPQSNISRVVQVTQSDPGTTDLHLNRPDYLRIRAAYLPGGQTDLVATSVPYSLNTQRGIELLDDSFSGSVYVVCTTSGSNTTPSSVTSTITQDQFKAAGIVNSGVDYEHTQAFSPYYNFPFLGSTNSGFSGVKPDTAALYLTLGLMLQDLDDAELKGWGGNIVAQVLPWLSKTWKVTSINTSTNTDFGIYSINQFSSIDVPSGTDRTLMSVSTTSGSYYTYVRAGKTNYTLADFVSSSFLTPTGIVGGYSTVVSGYDIVGRDVPALELSFTGQGYANIPFTGSVPPVISLTSNGYCRITLVDSQGWRYSAQVDNQTLVDWNTKGVQPDIYQKNYTGAPPLGTYPLVNIEVHGYGSVITVAWLGTSKISDSVLQADNVYKVSTDSTFPITVNSLVNNNAPYQGAYPYFIGDTGINPYYPTTNTPFRGPLSVLQQAPIIYAIENDLVSARAVVSLIKDAQDYYFKNAKVGSSALWDGKIDTVLPPFFTGVAPSYCYDSTDSLWSSGSTGFSWKSPMENWSDARSTYRMYFHLALYWRQANIQSVDYPSDIVEIFQRMVGGIQYMYNVVYAVGTEEELTKANIAVSGSWPAYMRSLSAGDKRLFWTGFGKAGPSIGHNFGAVCYAVATMILIYQAGMKDQKLFDCINRLLNTLFSYAGSSWWDSTTDLTDPILTTNWTEQAYTNVPELSDFYILNGEDYGILMYTLGLIDQYMTDIDIADAYISRFPTIQKDVFRPYTQVERTGLNTVDNDATLSSSTSVIPPSIGAPTPNTDQYTVFYTKNPQPLVTTANEGLSSNTVDIKESSKVGSSTSTGVGSTSSSS